MGISNEKNFRQKVYLCHTKTDVFKVIEVPPIYDGEAMTDRKSKFQAHLASVSKKEQVRQTLFVTLIMTQVVDGCGK